MDLFRYHGFIACMGCALLCTTNMSNASEPLPASSTAHQLTIFKQQLGLHFPTDWRLAYSEQSGNMFSAEFVPQQEMLTSWSSLYCIQGFKGMADGIEPEEFLDTFAANYQQVCEGEMQYNKLGATQIEGKESFSAMLTCSKMPHTHKGKSGQGVGMGEIGHYTVISGSEDLFLLHQSARGEALLSPTTQLSLSIEPPVKMVSDIKTLR